jgi:excisionase family DNA binding protein
MDLLLVDEVAAELRISAVSVRRHIRSGVLPGVRVGGLLRVARADLDAYLAGSRIAPTGGDAA